MSNPGELAPGADAALVREPNNPYDGNAVAVYDDCGLRVGYLPKEMAALLAPLMDARTLHASAAAAPESDPRTAEFAPRYFVPLDLHFYGDGPEAPAAWRALQEEAQGFTPDGRLVRRADGRWYFDFGKHNGRSVAYVAEEDPGYFDWLLGRANLPTTLCDQILEEIENI